MIKKVVKKLKENALFLILMAIVVTLCSIFFVTTISGESMCDTYKDGEIVFCTRIFDLERKDVIVCDSDEGRRLIKRVIAVGGDTIDIEDGKVFINGRRRKEQYLKEKITDLPENAQEFPMTIPEGKIFVMGDNRNHSTDSRDTQCGLISEENVIGKVLFKVPPF